MSGRRGSGNQVSSQFPSEPLFRRRHVLSLLSISGPTLDRLVESHALRTVRLGRRAVRIPLVAVHEFIARCERRDR